MNNTTNAVDTRPLMVSIWCITYNHEPYIRQCLEGFVMQKTNFRFEAIVHDDASTDGTAAIIRKYAEKYPEIIKPIFETENQYSKHDGSLDRIMDTTCTGKYIALCEGDDYWTNPNKLQIQVDFMENHPDYSMCWHNGEMISAIDGSIKGTFARYPQDKLVPVCDIIIGGGNFCPTASLFYRRNLKAKAPTYLFNQFVGDYPLQLYMAFTGKVFYFSKSMCVYRVNVKGSWMTNFFFNENKNDRNERLKNSCKIYDDFNKFTNNKYAFYFEQRKYLLLFEDHWKHREYGAARKIWYKISLKYRTWNLRKILYLHGYSLLKKWTKHI